MAAVLNTNVASLFNINALNKSKHALDTSLARLSSGSRINSAKDDATGLQNATKLDSQYRGTMQAMRNANDGIALAQTNDSYNAQITENLQRMRELAVQAGGTLVLANSPEGQALVDENARINGLITATGSVVVASDGSTVTGVGAKATLGTTYTVAGISTDLDNVAKARASFGADMATFQSAANNLGNASVNIAAQLSAIMDTDYASETANMTKNNILQQAGMAALSQANQAPQNITSLLR